MSSSAVGESNSDVARHYIADQREEIIDEIFDWLFGLSNITNEQSRMMEKLTGLNKNQVLTIKAVSRSPSVRVSDLARSMHLKPATMVRILDHLEEQGFVNRYRSKEDRRVVNIEPTEKAKGIGLALRKITHKGISDCLDTTNGSDLMNILDALKKLSSLIDTAYLQSSQLCEVNQ